MEIWKPIEGLEIIAKVSNHGRVAIVSEFRKNKYFLIEPRILNFEKLKNGYLRVTISNKGKSIRFLVSQLVAKHFLSKENENQTCVKHLDGNKENNRADNLIWITQTEAAALGAKNVKNKQIGETHYNSKLTIEIVNKIREEINLGIKQSDLAKKYSISPSRITAIKKGETWK